MEKKDQSKKKLIIATVIVSIIISLAVNRILIKRSRKALRVIHVCR